MLLHCCVVFLSVAVVFRILMSAAEAGTLSIRIAGDSGCHVVMLLVLMPLPLDLLEYSAVCCRRVNPPCPDPMTH